LWVWPARGPRRTSQVRQIGRIADLDAGNAGAPPRVSARDGANPSARFRQISSAARSAPGAGYPTDW